MKRKFLVKKDLLMEALKIISLDNCYKIKQGYLVVRPGLSIRINTSTRTGHLRTTTDFCIYVKTDTSRKAEFFSDKEIEIEELFQECLYPPIEKTRWEVKYYVGSDENDDVLYNVDIFHGENEGLILAKIKLYLGDREFFMPNWLGQEITNDPRYRNLILSTNPYKIWREEE